MIFANFTLQRPAFGHHSRECQSPDYRATRLTSWHVRTSSYVHSDLSFISLLNGCSSSYDRTFNCWVVLNPNNHYSENCCIPPKTVMQEFVYFPITGCLVEWNPRPIVYSNTNNMSSRPRYLKQQATVLCLRRVLARLVRASLRACSCRTSLIQAPTYALLCFSSIYFAPNEITLVFWLLLLHAGQWSMDTGRLKKAIIEKIMRIRIQKQPNE